MRTGSAHGICARDLRTESAQFFLDVQEFLWYTVSVLLWRGAGHAGFGYRPRLRHCGLGVIEYVGNRFAPLGYGAVITEKDTPFEQRLAEIYDGVLDICRRYKPEALSIEKLYYQHNQTTVIGVAEARGVILLAAAQCGIPIYEYTPMQVKQAITGYGKAVKKQIQEMTRMMLHLESVPKPDDTADALGMAIAHCHCSRSRLMGTPVR